MYALIFNLWNYWFGSNFRSEVHCLILGKVPDTRKAPCGRVSLVNLRQGSQNRSCWFLKTFPQERPTLLKRHIIGY